MCSKPQLCTCQCVLCTGWQALAFLCVSHLTSHLAHGVFLTFFTLKLQACVFAHITLNKLTVKNSTSKVFTACLKLVDINNITMACAMPFTLGGWSPSETIFTNATKKRGVAMFGIMYSETCSLEMPTVSSYPAVGFPWNSRDVCLSFYFGPSDNILTKPEVQWRTTLTVSDNCDPGLFHICLL